MSRLSFVVYSSAILGIRECTRIQKVVYFRAVFQVSEINLFRLKYIK
jgi:hypothetical protein